MVKIKYANKLGKLEFELKELNKIIVLIKSLHEIKDEMLGDVAGEFERVQNMSVGDQVLQTHLRFRNITGYATQLILILLMKVMTRKIVFLWL